MDKLGHGFTSYALTNALAERLLDKGRDPQQAALSAALTTQAIMLYVEAFDGFSNDHGFSKEDVLMNLLGSGVAYARIVQPGMRDLVDFRMEYKPSGYKGFKPLSDYSGQKYLVAFKLGGVPALRNTPLKYVELQGGYYTRGFSKAEAAEGMGRTRRGFVGVGINLNELLLGRRNAGEGAWRKTGRFALEHVQLPGTAVRAQRDF